MTKVEQFNVLTAPIVARMQEQQAPYITAYNKAKSAYNAIMSQQAALYAKAQTVTNNEQYYTLHAEKMNAIKAKDHEKAKELAAQLRTFTDEANQIQQEAHDLDTAKEAAQIKKNLYAREVIQIQARYCYDIVLAFTAVYAYEGLTSHSKRAKIIKETILNAGVNLDYDYTIRPEGTTSGTRNAPSINIKTGKYDVTYSARALEPEETKAARDEIPQPTPIQDIETRAEVAAQALAMIRTERQRYINDVVKLRPYIEGTGLESELERNLYITYIP